MTATMKTLTLLALVWLTQGCATPTPYDYSALRASAPRSILVLPPLNNSVEVLAPYTFLATISQSLGEKGYYVFPVAVVDQLFKQNGLPTPAEMHMAPLDRISEIIGPDAVLYVTIKQWGQEYTVISSRAVVSSDWRLIDARTGQQIWSSTAYAAEESGGSSLESMLVQAIVNQVVGSIVDRTPELSMQANWRAVNDTRSGLLPGPYRPPEVTK